MYEVVATKQVLRTLSKLPRNKVELIWAKIEEVASDPYQIRNNVTKLVNREGYRLRVGDWRVLYELQDDKLILLIVKIGPRGEVYE